MSLTYTDIPDTDVDADSPITVNLMTLLRNNPIAALEDYIGCMFFHGATTPPASTLECDGSAISRTTFADLFAIIGTTWGIGDGSTTFNIPDMRGEFPRGWDNGRGVDSGRSLGTSQSYQFTQHNHSWTTSNTDTGSGATSQVHHTDGQIAINANVAPGNINNITTTSSGGTDNGSETRPRNQAGMFVIVYKGKPT